MADEVDQYFVTPSGKVGIVDPENVEEAIRRGFKRATEEQRRQYDAVKAAKAEPLGAAKAFAQKLGEGVVGLAGVPAAIMTAVPSTEEIEAWSSGIPTEAAEIAKKKRLELAGEMARYTTLPGLQQEFGLRTAEEIKAGEEAFPKASVAGTIASFYRPCGVEDRAVGGNPSRSCACGRGNASGGVWSYNSYF